MFRPMVFRRAMMLSVTAITLGCALPIKHGDKATDATLKRLLPVQQKVSLYVCREDGQVAREIRSAVVVDGVTIGMLLPKTFAHTTLAPGSHSVQLRNESPLMPASSTGELKFDGAGGDVVLLWVGVTGGGWGALTVDHFDTRDAAIECMNMATYTVVAE